MPNIHKLLEESLTEEEKTQLHQIQRKRNLLRWAIKGYMLLPWYLKVLESGMFLFLLFITVIQLVVLLNPLLSGGVAYSDYTAFAFFDAIIGVARHPFAIEYFVALALTYPYIVSAFLLFQLILWWYMREMSYLDTDAAYKNWTSFANKAEPLFLVFFTLFPVILRHGFTFLLISLPFELGTNTELVFLGLILTLATIGIVYPFAPMIIYIANGIRHPEIYGPNVKSFENLDF